MAGAIKGITIEIGGNTEPLNKSLEGVNKKTRDLQGELKSVERLLKLDPKNTELLAQKQKLLGEQVENSAEKLNRLKTAQEQVEAAFRKGDIGEEQYRHFSRQVINAEQDLGKFEKQLKEVGETANKTGIDLADMGGKLKGIGTGMAMGVTAPLVGGVIALTEGTRELRVDMGKLEAQFTTSGFSAEQAKQAYYDFYGILGEADTAIEAVNHLAELTNNQEDLSKWTDIATGVFAKFGDSLPIEGLTEAANETAKVGEVTGPLADALNWVGVSEDAFNESLAACSSEQERQALITETLTGLYGEAAAKYREVNGEVIAANEANAKLTASLAQLGATLEPILTPIVEKVTELVNKFNEMEPGGQKVVLIVAGIAAAIGPLLVVVGSLITIIGGLTLPIAAVIAGIAALVAAGVLLYKNWDEIKAKATEIWTAIKDFFSEIIEGIKTGWTEGMASMKKALSDFGKQISDIWTNLWNGIKTTVGDTWNGIKTNLGSLWDSVLSVATSTWGRIKTAITQPIEAAKQTVVGIISSIKNAFANFRIEIPRPKLPHVEVNWRSVGVGDARINIPDFDLNWYKTGGIFDRPSIIGVGEAGKEAVIPLDKLPGMIAGALREAMGGTQAALPGGGVVVQQMIVRNDNDIKQVARELYNLQQQNARGRGIT